MKINKIAGDKKDKSDDSLAFSLTVSHQDEKNVITEKQLDSEGYFFGEKDISTEKQLEKVRTGAAEVLTEKRLDDSKSKFYTHRNESAYEGNINKLEEKRLAGKPVEKEKYEMASETTKKLRWWEKSSPDGLKVANKTPSMKKSAQTDDDENYYQENPSRWRDANEAQEWGGDDPDLDLDRGPIEELPKIVEKDEDEEAEDDMSEMEIIKCKTGVSPFPFVYIKMQYNESYYQDDEDAVKLAALEKAIETYPSLNGKVSIDDLRNATPSSGEISLRFVGDNLVDAINSIEGEEDGDLIPSSEFKLNVEVSSETGTPTARGEVRFNPKNSTDLEALVDKAVDFVNRERPDLSVDVDSFETENADEGVLRFIAQVEEEQPEESVATSAPESPAEVSAEVSDENEPLQSEDDFNIDLKQENTPSTMANSARPIRTAEELKKKIAKILRKTE